jgi:hypothetical protein
MYVGHCVGSNDNQAWKNNILKWANTMWDRRDQHVKRKKRRRRKGEVKKKNKVVMLQCSINYPLFVYITGTC